MAAPEVYLVGHKQLDDEVLLERPAQVLTPMTMFVCTYAAVLTNLKSSFRTFGEIICDDLRERRNRDDDLNTDGSLCAVVACNSNFDHAALPGFDRFIKQPKAKAVRPGPQKGRPRKVQGDGSCFNSSINPVVRISHPGVPESKYYMLKCFPSTGETQVPGALLEDLSDAHAALLAFVGYLNGLGAGTDGATIGVEREGPNMIDFKFRVVRSSPRILVNSWRLAEYIQALEDTHAVEGRALTDEQLARFAGWPAVLMPPFPLRETKSPTDDVKVTFKFTDDTRLPRVNIFQSGKINILGPKNFESGRLMYLFLVELFTRNWSELVSLEPRPDAEKRIAAPAPAVTNEALAEILDDLDFGAKVGMSDDEIPDDVARYRLEAKIGARTGTGTILPNGTLLLRDTSHGTGLAAYAHAVLGDATEVVIQTGDPIAPFMIFGRGGRSKNPVVQQVVPDGVSDDEEDAL